MRDRSSRDWNFGERTVVPRIRLAKQEVQTGREWKFPCLSGTGLRLEMEEPVPSWDALSSPVNALKRCRKDGTGHEKE